MTTAEPLSPCTNAAAIASMARHSSIRIRIPVAPLPSSDTQPTNSLASNSAATLNTAQAGNFKYVWLVLSVRLSRETDESDDRTDQDGHPRHDLPPWFNR